MMRWRDGNVLSRSQAETLIALRARRQAHQIAREVLNPHIETAGLADPPESDPQTLIALEYRAIAAVDHCVAEFTSDAPVGRPMGEALTAIIRRERAAAIAKDAHAARRHLPSDGRRAPVLIFVILFVAILICVGLIARELLRVL